MAEKTLTHVSIPKEPAPALLLALDLSKSKWKLAFCDGSGRKPRVRTVAAWDAEGLRKEVDEARKRFGLPTETEIKACHEAGRDGFSVHRFLERLGFASMVIDPASIETTRKKRKRKTDRLDALKLLAKLRAYLTADRGVWTVVRVPTEKQEDARRLTRERSRLRDERTQHRARIKSLLATVGLDIPLDSRFIARLREAVSPYGTPVLPGLRQEILREVERLELVESQQEEVMRGLERAVAEPESKSSMLHQLKGIGLIGATVLVREFFGWREFRNRREVGSAAGLTGTPFDSGDSELEQGIDKAGNCRVRTLMVELAWNWLRYQPDSKVTLWYRARFDDGTKRSKRKGIVAVARRLLVDLWKYIEFGVVPDGAIFRTEPEARKAVA